MRAGWLFAIAACGTAATPVEPAPPAAEPEPAPVRIVTTQAELDGLRFAQRTVALAQFCPILSAR